MKVVHYVLSVHWDREWYQTFEEFRIRLLPLMDEVLEGIESGEMRGPFVTDGQTIMLEDYLELRPEKQEQIIKFIQEEKIETGAWYVMPDLFQVSGESLIRNIEWGLNQRKQWGGSAAKSLNCCDVFGLNSQMPQIAVQFGLEAAYLWRGINQTQQRHLLWIGADGTELPCFRFGKNGYWHYSVQVREGCNRDDSPHKKEFHERLDRVLKDEESCSPCNLVLLFDGMDHSHWDREYYKLLMQSDQGKGVVHSSLDRFAEQLYRERQNITLTIQRNFRQKTH